MLTPVQGFSKRVPFIQYGIASGSTSPITVPLNDTYSDTSFIIQATHRDVTANKNIAVYPISPSTFSLYWNGGAGSQNFYYTTFGF